jgi:hypothetical protein
VPLVREWTADEPNPVVEELLEHVIDTGKYERLREYRMENGRSTPAGLFTWSRTRSASATEESIGVLAPPATKHERHSRCKQECRDSLENHYVQQTVSGRILHSYEVEHR